MTPDSPQDNQYKPPSKPIPAAWEAASEEPKPSWAKKVLLVMGGIFAVLLVVAAIGIGTAFYFGRDLDKQSQAYADASINAIVAGWDWHELDRRASPELKAVMKPGDAEKLFAVLGKIGKLKQYMGSRGQATMGYDAVKGRMVVANYVAGAEFEGGKAEILLSLIQRDGEWSVTMFRVNSPAYMPK